MVDIAIVWDVQNSRGDWTTENGGLAVDQGGLRSAVLVSLFTDGRAPDDITPPDGSNDRRGNWSDTYEAEPLGSLFWLLARAKKTGETSLLRRAENYGQAALKWLLNDKVAKTVTVAARWITATAMGIKIVIVKPSGSAEAFDFGWAWNGL